MTGRWGEGRRCMPEPQLYHTTHSLPLKRASCISEQKGATIFTPLASDAAPVRPELASDLTHKRWLSRVTRSTCTSFATFSTPVDTVDNPSLYRCAGFQAKWSPPKSTICSAVSEAGHITIVNLAFDNFPSSPPFPLAATSPPSQPAIAR